MFTAFITFTVTFFASGVFVAFALAAFTLAVSFALAFVVSFRIDVWSCRVGVESGLLPHFPEVSACLSDRRAEFARVGLGRRWTFFVAVFS
jgi:hypothetical protein